MKHSVYLFGLSCLLSGAWAAEPAVPAQSTRAPERFRWPAGKAAAVSLTFDDARLSQVDRGLDLLKRCGVKATFYVSPKNVVKRLEGWKRAVAEGHEIGNHTLTHPCTGNYGWVEDNPLESYTLAGMAEELDRANVEIQRLLGVKPVTFAYPCGQKFIGRGREVKSYVPLVAERFLAGRGFYDTAINDPMRVDLAQATGIPCDDMSLEEMLKLVRQTAEEGRWLILAGHEIGQRGFHVTDARALEDLCRYAQDPTNGLWLDRVDNVARYVIGQQEKGR